MVFVPFQYDKLNLSKNSYYNQVFGSVAITDEKLSYSQTLDDLLFGIGNGISPKLGNPNSTLDNGIIFDSLTNKKFMFFLFRDA